MASPRSTPSLDDAEVALRAAARKPVLQLESYEGLRRAVRAGESEDERLSMGTGTTQATYAAIGVK